MYQNNSYYQLNTRKRKKKKKKIYLSAFLAVFALIAMVIAVNSAQPSASTESGGTSSDSIQTSQQKQPSEVPEKDTSSDGNSKKHADSYDYTSPVPEAARVNNDYFNDAVFIGDSRTEGLILYTGLSNAISYTHKGLMVDTVFTSPVINKNGKKLSVMDALRQTDFSKVYIMLGINETGWPYNSIFIEKYGKIIDEIKAINPKAIIYVQEILPVTKHVSETHSYVKNSKINEYNALLRKMTYEKQVYYIDAGRAVSASGGLLPEDAAIDGIHLKKPYCEKWLDYLKTHTVTDIER